MKTYKELEREAYITGNTELAKLYAAADAAVLDVDVKELRKRCDEAESVLEQIKDIVMWL